MKIKKFDESLISESDFEHISIIIEHLTDEFDLKVAERVDYINVDEYYFGFWSRCSMVAFRSIEIRGKQEYPLLFTTSINSRISAPKESKDKMNNIYSFYNKEIKGHLKSLGYDSKIEIINYNLDNPIGIRIDIKQE